jgi:hypothetical protein
MIWTDFGSSLALSRRRRVVATALMYGLTLTVRLTSATGDEADAPAKAQGSDPMASIMINDRAPILIGDWHRGALLNSRACPPACEIPLRVPFTASCASRQ